tara:strand:- start:1175 stop:2560 length:1386 start_codon:yes stop_codon:yes gene_type:complete
MATTYLNKTFSTPTNRKKYTMAGWFKRSGLSSNQYIYSYDSGGNAMFVIGFYATDKFTVYDRDASSGSDDINYTTTRVFRDTAAWYHFVVAVDTTDSTSGDRVKIYVNGARLTNFDTSTAPAQDYDTIANSAISKDIGRWQAGSNYYDGFMSQFIFIDGSALTPSSFGSTNADGVWIPNTNPSVTYGTNGFKLEFKDSGASAAASNFGADTSGNNNHFASNNLGTNPNTSDSPANNFAILNINDRYNSHTTQETVQGVLTKAGRKFASNGQLGGSERYYNTTATIAIPSAGKWYWEVKPVAGSNGLGFRWTMGLQGLDRKYSTANFREQDNSQGMWASYTADGKVSANGSTVATYSTIAVDDILSFKYDADNRDLFIAKNGTYFNSGNAVLTSSNISNTDQKLVFLQNGSDGNTATEVNFGNPPYTIASGNSDANGYGNFEYAVPSGYYALCSKNVGLYGG